MKGHSRNTFSWARSLPMVKGLSTICAAGATAVATVGLLPAGLSAVAVVAGAAIGSTVLNSTVDVLTARRADQEMIDLKLEIRELRETVESLRTSVQFVRDMIIFVSSYLVLREVAELIAGDQNLIFVIFLSIAVLLPLLWVPTVRREIHRELKERWESARKIEQVGK